MTTKRSKTINHQIESICKKGCDEVSKILDKAEDGSEIRELSEFSRKEVNIIIDELSEIMAVYEKEDDSKKR